MTAVAGGPHSSRNFTVLCRDRRGRTVLVKAAAPAGLQTLGWEARVLHELAPLLLAAPGSFRAPRCLEVAPRGAALAIEWLPRTATLFAHHRRTGGTARALARQLGIALGRLHSARPPAGTSATFDLTEQLLWPTPDFYATLNPAGLTLLARVQARRGASQALAGLAKRARTEARFIHGDFRQANVLIGRGRPALVDWELSGLGDPASDLGMLLGDYLLQHLAPSEPGDALGLAAFRAVARALLAGYRSARPELDPRFVLAVLGWSGQALLRSVYTLAHHLGRFEANESKLVDCGLALICEPQRWRRRFLA